ncbi:MAG TPA: hypothetical protein PKD86_03290 [Gemmatales bacterium]|nr:hypothetical protein [Gemmatales bacterium]
MSDKDAAAPTGAARMPPVWVRMLISVLVCGHLTAVLLTVSGASSAAFPAPAPLSNGAREVRPYLQSIFMTNAYRFYAPDPGPCDLLWVCFHYTDGSTRWKEMPRRADFPLRMPFQRQLALLLLLNMYFEPAPAFDPDTPEATAAALMPVAVGVPRVRLTDTGRILFRSIIRHLARLPGFDQTASGATLKTLDAYRVRHLVITPQQVRLGWRYDDPRLYLVEHMGTYTPTGSRASAPEDKPFQARNIEGILAEIVQDQLAPRLDPATRADPNKLEAALEAFGLPTPFRWPLLKSPQLFDIRARVDLEREFVRTVMAEDKVEMRPWSVTGNPLSPVINAPRMGSEQTTVPPSPR